MDESFPVRRPRRAGGTTASALADWSLERSGGESQPVDSALVVLALGRPILPMLLKHVFVTLAREHALQAKSFVIGAVGVAKNNFVFHGSRFVVSGLGSRAPDRAEDDQRNRREVERIELRTLIRGDHRCAEDQQADSGDEGDSACEALEVGAHGRISSSSSMVGRHRDERGLIHALMAS